MNKSRAPYKLNTDNKLRTASALFPYVGKALDPHRLQRPVVHLRGLTCRDA